LTLFRDDLFNTLAELLMSPFDSYRAVIRPPQSHETIEGYRVIKIRDAIPQSSLTTRHGRPGLFVVPEHINAVVVTAELRRILEDRGIPGLTFYEPLFFGPISGNVI
jgi:hypothetical protein